MRHLLDNDVFFAAMYEKHVLHKQCRAWLDRAKPGGWAVAAETYLAAVRLLMNPLVLRSGHLTGPEAFHISKVLRYREGQSLILFDGKGGRFEAKIVKIHPDGSVSGDVTGTLASLPPQPAYEMRTSYSPALGSAGVNVIDFLPFSFLSSWT